MKYVPYILIIILLSMCNNPAADPESLLDIPEAFGLDELPEVPDGAGGSELLGILLDLDINVRERVIYDQLKKGNYPDFLDEFCAVEVKQNIDNTDYSLTFFALPDYLAIGSNDDYFHIPIRPDLAQSIADLWNCSLPTPKMVDEIYAAAPVKLQPHPMTPDATMTTLPVFYEHSKIIQAQRDSMIDTYPLGTLTSGNKKDVVITNKLAGSARYSNVAIYGWHQLNGEPIQPLYTGHSKDWVDYSHGIRLISNNVLVNDDTVSLQSALQDPVISRIISDEGIVLILKYPARSSL